MENNFNLSNLGIFYNELDFAEEKDQKKYIKQLERTFRTSIEYRRWVYVQGTNRILMCPFTKITNEIEPSLIELHHHPYTLYNIIEMILFNLLDHNFNLNIISSFKIVEYIQNQHLLDLVPFVPLTKTYHEQYHKLESDLEIDGNTKIEIKQEWVINKDKIELFQKYLSDLTFFQNGS